MEVHAIMRQLVRVSRADFKKRRAFYLILGLICAVGLVQAAQGVCIQDATGQRDLCGPWSSMPARASRDAVTDQCRHGSLNALRPAEKQ